MKRIALIFITVCLIISAVACSNADKNETQNGGGGDGVKDGQSSVTEATPSGEIIEITDEDGLLAMANDMTATYVLKNDIIMTKSWKTVGTPSAPFVGTFDGGGFTIYNMTVSSDVVALDDTSINYMVGMFGVLSGTVKNLNVDSFTVSVSSASIAATDYASLLAANSGVTDFDIHVGIAGHNKGNIRGVCANVNYVVIPDCDIARVRIGGIAGKTNDEITDCTVNGDIRVQNANGYIRAGGIAGYISSNGIVQGSRANINLTAQITGEAKMQLGGLVGNVECGSIANCISTGSVTGINTEGKATLAGGLVGLIDNTDTKYEDMSVTVIDSYSTVDVSVSGAKGYAAGFIGQVDFGGKVNIKGNACSGLASGAKGSFGFVGRIQNSVGEQVYSSSFTNGSYDDTVVIQSNKSVTADAFSTQVSEIVLPN